MYNRILIFLAIHTALSINQQKTSKIKFSEKLIVPKLMNGCKNIQCPTQEDPVCVEIKFNKNDSANKTLYIIMLNKCELQYTKCHQGLEAIVVPMKYCRHEIVSKAGKRRFKREIEALPQTVKKLNKTKQKKVKKVEPKKVQPKAIRQGDKSDYENGNYNYQETEHELSNNDDDDASFHEYENIALKDTNKFDSEDNNRTATELQAMIKESKADCPKQCPIRDVMVCAKCQHGVYKTFSSVCHMRMFSCDHPDEVLELMSRSPCVLSAPYFETKHVQPKSEISERDDQDIILRYIKCRQRARESVPNMNNGIPQIPLDCNFNKRNKMFWFIPFGFSFIVRALIHGAIRVAVDYAAETAITAVVSTAIEAIKS